jgi:hypothetical protein
MHVWYDLRCRGDQCADESQEVDNELRKGCEALIDQCFAASTQDLRKWMQSIPPSKPGSTKPPAKHAADESLVGKVHTEFKKTCEREVTWWVEHLRLYLESEQTAGILIAPLQAQVAEAYGQFLDVVRKEYAAEVGEGLMSLSELWTFMRDICS